MVQYSMDHIIKDLPRFGSYPKEVFVSHIIMQLGYTSFFRILPEIKSIIVIIAMIPSSIIPTRSQFRELSAKINGVPIPLLQSHLES